MRCATEFPFSTVQFKKVLCQTVIVLHFEIHLTLCVFDFLFAAELIWSTTDAMWARLNRRCDGHLSRWAAAAPHAMDFLNTQSYFFFLFFSKANYPSEMCFAADRCRCGASHVYLLETGPRVTDLLLSQLTALLDMIHDHRVVPTHKGSNLIEELEFKRRFDDFDFIMFFFCFFFVAHVGEKNSWERTHSLMIHGLLLSVFLVMDDGEVESSSWWKRHF